VVGQEVLEYQKRRCAGRIVKNGALLQDIVFNHEVAMMFDQELLLEEETSRHGRGFLRRPWMSESGKGQPSRQERRTQRNPKVQVRKDNPKSEKQKTR
jgi:hypothetical protein